VLRCFLGYMIGSARRRLPCGPRALENRARPPFPGAPTAGDVFAYSEHAVGRAGCTGARLVGKVKDDSVPSGMLEIVARMTRCPPRCDVKRECVSVEQGLASTRIFPEIWVSYFAWLGRAFFVRCGSRISPFLKEKEEQHVRAVYLSAWTARIAIA
jgi:hypothetical protein